MTEAPFKKGDIVACKDGNYSYHVHIQRVHQCKLHHDRWFVQTEDDHSFYATNCRRATLEDVDDEISHHVSVAKLANDRLVELELMKEEVKGKL